MSSADEKGQALAEAGVPMFNETMAGALIDSARISVTAARSLLPPPSETPLIMLAGEEEAPPTVHECLEQAASWLDAARVQSLVAGAPVTSLHHVPERGR